MLLNSAQKAWWKKMTWISGKELKTESNRRVWYLFNTFVGLFLSLSFALTSHAQQTGQSKDTRRSLLSAEQASWDWQKGHFQLMGKVHLKLKIKDSILSIKCQEASLYLKQTSKGNLEQALPKFNQDTLKKVIVKGEIELRYKSITIKTDELEYEHPNGKITVSGLLRGRWGENRLSGRGLKMNIHQGQALVSNPKIQFMWNKDTFKQSIWGR